MEGNSLQSGKPVALLRSLERVWGIDWPPRIEMLVRVNRPHGFIVAERRLRARDPQGFLVYLARKEGVPTSKVARDLSGRLGARAYPLGLKDADAIAYQYIIVEPLPREPPERLEGEGYIAWLVGRRGKAPSIGAHLWNNFRLHITVIEGDPREFCRLQGGILVPGFYGPQRFGVERPTTHIYALHRLLPEPGRLLAEYGYKYPLEGNLSYAYEARILEEARVKGDPLLPLRKPPSSSVVRDAIQSYIWNRALSQALDEQGRPTLYEKKSRALCPGERTVYLARLPSRSLLSGRGDWASLVRRIVREEGIPGYVLPGKAPFRPLTVEACRFSCMVVGGDSIVVWVTLPRGIYATIAVRTIAWVNWLG